MLWVSLLILHPTRVETRNPITLFFLLYVIADFLSSSFSIDPAGSFIGMKRLFLFLNIYFTMSVVTSSRRLLQLIFMFVGAVSLASIIELITGRMGVELSERLSLFQHYMTEGGIKMFALLIAIPLVIHKDTSARLRIWLVSVLLPIGIALLLTQTRSSWLGALAGLLIVGMVREKKALLVLLAILVGFAFLAPHTLTFRAMSIFDARQTSNLSRIHMIETGFRMFRDFPVLGTGDVDLHSLYVQYTKPIDPGEGGHLHNNIIQALVTLGALGFVALMMLYVAIGWSLWKAFRATRSHWLYGSVCLGGCSAYVGFHLNGLFEYNFGDHEIAAILWFVVGLCYSTGHLLDSEVIKPHV